MLGHADKMKRQKRTDLPIRSGIGVGAVAHKQECVVDSAVGARGVGDHAAAVALECRAAGVDVEGNGALHHSRRERVHVEARRNLLVGWGQGYEGVVAWGGAGPCDIGVGAGVRIVGFLT